MFVLAAGGINVDALAGQPPLWWIGFAFSTITAIAFLAIGWRLASSLRGSGHVKSNPLALATGAIFLSCGGGHLIHSRQLLYLYVGASTIGLAARVHYMDWHLWVVDGFTAVAGILYWAQRRRFPGMVRGAALYEDLRERKRDALELNDTVVQNLNAARLSLRAGDVDGAREGLEAARQGGRP